MNSLIPLLSLALIAGAGCSKPATTPTSQQAPDSSLRPKIVGAWTTSTAPEMAAGATTIKFLESGEYQASGVLMVQGQPVMMEKDGKKMPVPSTVSGTWDFSGDEIRVRVTQSSIQGKFEPFTYKVKDAGAKRLLLDKAGEEVALFRIEPLPH